MDWTDVLKAIASLALAVGSAVAPVVLLFIHKHFTTRQVQVAKDLARVAVQAVEQISRDKGWASDMKYNNAVAMFDRLSEQMGVHFPGSIVNSMIESAVHELPQMLTGVLAEAAPIFNTPPSVAGPVGVSPEEIARMVEEVLARKFAIPAATAVSPPSS